MTAYTTDNEALKCLKTSIQSHRAESRFKSLKKLFIAKPDFDYEKHYNCTQGRIFPHCSICQYFVPDLNLRTELTEPFTIPKHSPRYTTNGMFNKSGYAVDATMAPKDAELLQCSSCNVVIHRQCYLQIPTEDGLSK